MDVHLHMIFNEESSYRSCTMACSCHWLTITTIGAEKEHVFVYDSLHPSVGSNTKLQIAALLNTSAPHISLEVVNCQRQRGGSDCGLFAVAFATALANGLCPESYTFKQKEMRQHLYNCLKLAMFPAVPRKIINPPYQINREDTSVL